MKKILIFIILVFCTNVNSQPKINANGELRALRTDGYTPPRVRGIWQYTIAFMAEDGSVVKKGMPVLMFKTDAIQTKLIDAQGKLSIKKSELENKSVNNIEEFENKKINIEEKKMELEKARRKAELPQALVAQNEYFKNQLQYELAKSEYESAKLDLELGKQKSETEKQITKAEIDKLEAEIEEYTQSISSMKMFAQSDGIVIHKSGWDKNKFAVGDTVWGGQRVIEVANLEQIIARLDISESDINSVREGQNVIVRLDSLPDKEYGGHITTLSKVVKVKSKNQPGKILEATVFIDSVDTEVMRPGMRLNAVIQVTELNAGSMTDLTSEAHP